MNKRTTSNPEMDTERLIIFSDGVFAIAITLLILEIKVPTHDMLHASGGLYAYLKGLWPSYLAYVISFFMIGIYWSNHHWLFSFIIRKTDHLLNLLHILFLMTVAFMPFTTAILGDYVMDHEYRSAAVSAYCIGYFFPVPAVLLLFLYADRRKLTDQRLTQAYIRRQIKKLYASMGFCTIAFLFSFTYPVISLAMIGAGFILYTLPPEKPEYLSIDVP